MNETLHLAMRSIHIILGSLGFVLGFAALILPKFGVHKQRHRWVGRFYAVCMLGMAGLSVPLAWNDNNTFLLIIGALTFAWVAGGWIALRRWRDARARGERERATNLLQTHIILMGSSYIAAWTAFLINIEPLGVGPMFWIYAFGPTIIGTALIMRTTRRYERAGAK